MKLKLYNAKIMLSPSEDIFEGEVFTEGIYIKKVVKKGDTCDLAFDRQIDLGGNLLISGFCNNHTHMAMSLLRGFADDLPLESWLYDKIFPIEAKLDEEDVYYSVMLQMAEFARNGITAAADMYMFDHVVAECAKKSGIAVALCGGLNDLKEPAKQILKKIGDSYHRYNGQNERLKYIIGLHAEYTCSDALIEGTADLAVSLGAPTYIHLSETLKEVGDCTARRQGLTPPAYLHKAGFFDGGGIAAHCTYLDKDDMALLRDKNVYPAINPASNLKLASGVAPVYSMLKEGLTLTLGTDGAASNNATSMFREMYLFSCLQKESLKLAEAVGAQTALAAATVNGYKSLGFNGGKIKEGGFADLAVIDLSAPNMQPPNDLKNHLVYSADNSNVLMTVAGGRVIYERGEYFIGEDIEKIYSECQKRIKRLKA